MTLEQKVEELRHLRKTQKTVEGRIKYLREEILREPQVLIEQCGMTVQERDKTSFDESNVWSLMHQKGVPEEDFTHLVLDEGKIEGLYYEGILSDSDLRYIRKPKYDYALVEQEIVNVQE